MRLNTYNLIELPICQCPGDADSWRLGRADANIIPFHNQEMVQEVGKVVPDYAGRLSSSSFLVPTFPVSVLDVQVMGTADTAAIAGQLIQLVSR